jgi:hypothetical protein
VSYTINPVAGDPILFISEFVILGGKKPCLLDDKSIIDDVSGAVVPTPTLPLAAIRIISDPPIFMANGLANERSKEDTPVEFELKDKV